MMTKIAFAVPGKITNLTGGTIYDQRVVEALARQGFDVQLIELASSFPAPSPEDMDRAFALLSRVQDDTLLIIDGLAYGALDTSRLGQLNAPCFALVHHPLAEEGGLCEVRRAQMQKTEAENLKIAQRTIVTSPHTAELLSVHYGVPAQKITIAVPGVVRPKLQSIMTNPPLILAVGIQLPRKGHDILLHAFSQIKDLEWKAVIVGASLDEKYSAKLEALRAKLNLEKHVTFAGRVERSELDQHYAHATIFALATRYEGYGIVFNEALVHGLPIVSCATGAVVDTVPENAGLLVQPDAPGELADALRKMLTDHDLRATCANNARLAGERLSSWSDTASTIAHALQQATDNPSF